MVSALIAISGVVIQLLVVCFTPASMIFLVYLASCFSILSACITTLCRSLITKVGHQPMISLRTMTKLFSA